jgi:invasion protein IalB
LEARIVKTYFVALGAVPALAVLFIITSPAGAQEVELKEKFGIWSVYCLKDAPQTRDRNCSITAGVHAKDNADSWVKVAITIAGPSNEWEMTVRTPKLTYLRNGISLGFDGRQAVKGFIDTCGVSSCESLIALDDRLVDQVGTSDRMSIEYQVAKDKGTVLLLDLDEIVPALRSLEQRLGLSSQAIASADERRRSKSAGKADPVTVVLERRRSGQSSPMQAMAMEGWKAPFTKCSGSPATKKVVLNTDLTLRNQKEVMDWAEKSSKCNPDGTVWIRQDAPAAAPTATTTGAAAVYTARLGSYAVHKFVNKIVPSAVIPDDDSRVAVVPPATYDAMPTTGQATTGFPAVRN